MQAREAVRRIVSLSAPLAPLDTGVAPTLRSLPGIRAVLFDVYGTLLVSASGEVGTLARGDRALALESAFGACGLASRAGGAERAAVLLPELIRQAHERSRQAGIAFPEVEIRGVFRRLLRALAEEGLVAEAGASAGVLQVQRGLCERLALEYECRINPTWPMPGARALLEGLRDAGLALGLVSNAQFYTPWLFPAHLGRDLGELGIDREICVWSYRLGEAKPSAALLARALERLSRRRIQAAAVVFVGNDLRNDIAPAVRLGCRTVLFAGDGRSYRPRTGEPELSELRPDAVITDLDQLPALLPRP